MTGVADEGTYANGTQGEGETGVTTEEGTGPAQTYRKPI
jgi:hypothetical protein